MKSCKYCGKLFDDANYHRLGAHTASCQHRPEELKSQTKIKQSKASLGRKHTTETKQKISKKRTEYLKNNPDKIPYVLNHSSKESYPESYFKKLLINVIQEYKIPNTLYRADFANPNDKTIIEIDGEQHYVDKKIIEHDIKRDKILKDLGYNVIRIRWAHYQKLNHEEKCEIIKSLNEKTTSVFIKEHKQKTCSCGKEIHKNSKTCRTCSVEDKINISKEQLLFLLESKTVTQIAKMYNCSRATINRRRRRFCIM